MSILGLLASIFISQVFAIDVSYPIPELGNCGGLDECATYCDLPANYAACSQWAEDKGPSDLPKADEAQVLEDLGITFPIAELGNCADTVACMAYCDQPANVQTCLRWAERHGVTSDEEVAAKMEGIAFPIAELGNCGSPSACADFCSQSGNMQACMDFSVAKGWGGGPPPGMGGIEGPGGCSSQQECDAYCEQTANREECTRWAEKHGMPHGGPGGCTIEAECRAYCEAHSEDEGCRGGPGGKAGPGGCTSEEECRQYCQAHPDDSECQGGGPEGEGGPGGPGPGGCQSEEECESYCREHPEDLDCERPKDGGSGGKDYEEGPPEGEYEGPPEGEEGPPGGGGPPAGEAGPGGCQTEKECRDYCSKNQGDPACQGGPPQ